MRENVKTHKWNYSLTFLIFTRNDDARVDILLFRRRYVYRYFFVDSNNE